MAKNYFRREIVEIAQNLGWSVEMTTNRHFRLTKYEKSVFTSSSPRNPSRTLANTLAEMKRIENAQSRVQ